MVRICPTIIKTRLKVNVVKSLQEGCQPWQVRVPPSWVRFRQTHCRKLSVLEPLAYLPRWRHSILHQTQCIDCRLNFHGESSKVLVFQKRGNDELEWLDSFLELSEAAFSPLLVGVKQLSFFVLTALLFTRVYAMFHAVTSFYRLHEISQTSTELNFLDYYLE